MTPSYSALGSSLTSLCTLGGLAVCVLESETTSSSSLFIQVLLLLLISHQLSLSQSVSLSVNQSISPSVIQSVIHSFSQSVGWSVSKLKSSSPLSTSLSLLYHQPYIIYTNLIKQPDSQQELIFIISLQHAHSDPEHLRQYGDLVLVCQRIL